MFDKRFKYLLKHILINWALSLLLASLLAYTASKVVGVDFSLVRTLAFITGCYFSFVGVLIFRSLWE